METAKFKLDNYAFTKAELDFSERKPRNLTLDFIPNGTFHTINKKYELTFSFMAKDSEGNIVVSVNCNAIYSFIGVEKLEDIPAYFYVNSIAIIFPYIRAFVSTLTLQANIPPIVLPTLNLSKLETVLKSNTKEME